MSSVFDDYKNGGKTRKGETIQFLIGSTDTFAVYITDQGDTRIDTLTDAPTDDQVRILDRFSILMSRVDASVPDAYKSDIKGQLAETVYRALAAPKLSKDPFSEVEHAIATRSRERTRYLYTTTGLICCLRGIAVVLVLILIFVLVAGPKIPDLLAVLLSGLLGTFASISTRGYKLEVFPYSQESYVKFQGMVRVLLGVALTLIAYIAMESDVWSGTHDIWSMTFVGVIAGFSEKFIPELLARFEKEKSES